MTNGNDTTSTGVTPTEEVVGTFVPQAEEAQVATHSDLQNLAQEFEDRLEKKTDEFESKIDVKQMKTTEILAVFITLFTFISVNVTIFTRVSDIHTATWFLLLMTACSTFLVSYLFIIINPAQKFTLKTAGLIFSFLLLVLILFVSRYTDWNPVLNEVEKANSSINSPNIDVEFPETFNIKLTK